MDLNLNPTDSLLNFEDKSALFMPLVPEKETLPGNRYLSNSTLNDRMVNYFINKRVNLRDCSFNTKSSACKGIEDKNDNGSGKIGGGINRQDYSCTNSDKYSHSGRDVGGTMSEDRNGGGAEAFGSYSTQNSSHNKYVLFKGTKV
ncbi:hypothetical protein AX774_g12 [Zancudomyces culisetae]|uniref:Uncharacterized protein n=1 Tax=Zancudomyces culisetae TaxID=1213189 RepID=A0A1R1PZQ0_ZANCU|nr:hypothetical protein AX774_g12 [Zancudomyces culisetae]|eukprot:OMH86424.1 hypothetical protein AX774_g12 [Zancudomyces culisetae]